MRSVIIVEKGVQDEEYIYPYYRLQEAGVKLEVAVKDASVELKGKYGIPIRATMSTSRLNADDFDSVIIPGGWESPERVRQDKHVLNFLQAMDRKKKVIAAICHGPWVLASAKLCKDRKMTCYVGMKDDLENAGANFVDAGVVVDDNIVTSPHYRNNPEFMRETLRLMYERERFVDYNDIVVTKPWGHEFLVTQNNQVGLWYLFLKPGELTSLHSHPRKKTGLVVLNGTAEVSFINGKHLLHPGDKIVIRNGVFHSTRNVGDTPLELLEVETPNDKLDIVRLEDAYGRSGKPYEGSDYYVPKREVWNLASGEKVGACNLLAKEFKLHNELIDLPECKIIALSGKLKSNGHDILIPGDVVDNVVLSRFAKKFDSELPISAIIVTKEPHA
jgi:protease I